MQLKSGFDPLESEAPVAPTSSWRGFAPDRETLPEDPLETLWQRAAGWFFLLLGVGYFLGIARGFTSNEDVLFGFMKSFMLIVPAWLILLYLYRRRFDHIPREHSIRRAEPPEPGPEEEWVPCPVKVGIYQHGVMTGEDDGFVWIDRGTVYFRGFHMAFRLNREDVAPLDEWARGSRPSATGLKLPKSIPLTIEGRNVGLKIEYIDPYRDFETRRCSMSFQKQFVQWLRERPPGYIESLMPPIQIHPKLSCDGFVLRESIIASCALIVLGFLLVFATMPAGLSVDFVWIIKATCLVASLFLTGAAVRQLLSHWHGLTVRRTLVRLAASQRA